MTLRLQIDPGGEKYFSFAKRKLDALKQWMVRAKVGHITRHFKISDSESVWVNSVHAGHGVFLDWIRITAGSGSIIIKTGPHEYAVFTWDGALVALADTTGHPHSGYAMHEAIGGLILFCQRTGPNAYMAYTVNAEGFGAVSGPEDYSAIGLASFTYWQPPAVDGVTPPKQWVSSMEIGSLTSLSGVTVARSAQDFSDYADTTISSGSTGTMGAALFQWNGDGSQLYFEIGRDGPGPDPEYAMIRVDPVTATFDTIHFPGTNTGLDQPSNTVPMCVTSTKAIRPVINSSTSAVTLDIRLLTDGSLFGTAAIPVVGTSPEFAALRAEDARAIVIMNTSIGCEGFVVDLATLAVTDITAVMSAWLTGAKIGFVQQSRAIILPGSISGAVVAPPEVEEGGGGGGPPRP